jgi:hypothetical protein
VKVFPLEDPKAAVLPEDHGVLMETLTVVAVWRMNMKHSDILPMILFAPLLQFPHNMLISTHSLVILARSAWVLQRRLSDQTYRKGSFTPWCLHYVGRRLRLACIQARPVTPKLGHRQRAYPWIQS